MKITKFSLFFAVSLSVARGADLNNAVIVAPPLAPSPERKAAIMLSEEIEKRTRGGGGEIVELMKTSSYYAAGTAVYKMVEAYMLDRKQVLPCAAYLDGEYGVKGLFAGVPVVIGAGGVERVVEIQLTAAEKTAFDSSVGHVRELVEAMDKVIAAAN